MSKCINMILRDSMIFYVYVSMILTLQKGWSVWLVWSFWFVFFVLHILCILCSVLCPRVEPATGSASHGAPALLRAQSVCLIVECGHGWPRRLFKHVPCLKCLYKHTPKVQRTRGFCCFKRQGDYPSRRFYDGELFTSPSVVRWIHRSQIAGCCYMTAVWLI